MRYFFLLALLSLSGFPAIVTAQSVSSFAVNPTSGPSGAPFDFYWTLQSSGGYSFLILCQPGIKLKYPSGSVLSCNTKISSTSATNDSIRIAVTNTSGGTRSVTARIIPKNSSGQDYDVGMSDVVVSVATIAEPITSFSASATSTSAGLPVTLSWTAPDIDGVNLQIECKDGIKVTSPSYTGFLPCDTPVFSNNLAGSGSLTLNFSNSSVSTVPVKITLLPATSPTTYDGTHASVITLNVASDILPDPAVRFFTASPAIVNSGEKVSLAWSTDYSKDANLRVSCPSIIAATSTKDSATARLPCDNTFAFSGGIGSSGTLSLLFTNSGKSDEIVVLTLLPGKKIGEYDTTRGKSISVTVRPVVPAATAAVTPAATVPTTAPKPAPAQAVFTPPLTPGSRAGFTQLLQRGSKGSQVTALQEFLKKDSTLYPEGLVTGFFGKLTELAVQRFQKKYGIVASGTPSTTGYGLVGPKTRVKLNEL